MLRQIAARINLCYNLFMRPFPIERVPRPTIDEKLHHLLSTETVDVEIGAGQGLHAVRYCKAEPGRKLVAIERTHTRFALLQRRKEKHPDLENLFVVHADAVSVFAHELRDESVDRIFLLYPNPYPKAKHSNLRWHNMPFMVQLLAKLKRGGQLVLATNIESYASEALEKLISEWRLELVSHEKVSDAQPARTHFEKKYLERGETCWNLTFRKN